MLHAYVPRQDAEVDRRDVADTIIDTNKIIACGTPMFRVRMQRWIAAVRSIPSPLVVKC